MSDELENRKFKHEEYCRKAKVEVEKAGIKIRSCPFCGKEGVLEVVNDPREFYVLCSASYVLECPACPNTTFFPSAIDAVTAWNTRKGKF